MKKQPMEVSEYILQRGPILCLNPIQNDLKRTLFQIPEKHIYIQDGVFTSPGLIEFMAQSVAFMLSVSGYQSNRFPVVAAVKHFELMKLPSIHDMIEATILDMHQFNRIVSIKMEVKVNEDFCAQGQIVVTEI